MKPIEYSPRTPIDIFPCPAVVMQICNRQKFRNNIRLKNLLGWEEWSTKLVIIIPDTELCRAKPLAIVVSVSWLFVWRSPLEGQYSDVSPPEGRIAQSIAERIDGGVDIAETVGDVPHHLRDHVALVLAQDGLHDGQHVVRGPGEDEDQQDGGQRLGRLALLTNQRSASWVSTNHSSPGASPASPSSACSSSAGWRRAWGRAWRPAPRRSSRICNIRLSISRINI